VAGGSSSPAGAGVSTFDDQAADALNCSLDSALNGALTTAIRGRNSHTKPPLPSAAPPRPDLLRLLPPGTFEVRVCHAAFARRSPRDTDNGGCTAPARGATDGGISPRVSDQLRSSSCDAQELLLSARLRRPASACVSGAAPANDVSVSSIDSELHAARNRLDVGVRVRSSLTPPPTAHHSRRKILWLALGNVCTHYTNAVLRDFATTSPTPRSV
jgi:hypothetical protein